MIMKKYYILLAVFTIMLSSCEKILDKEPTDKLSIEDLFIDVAGSKTALAGAYRALLDENHYQKNMMVYPDILGGNIKFSKTTNLRLEDIYNVIQDAQTSTMNDSYTTMYSELNNVNNIIKYVPSVSGAEAEKVKIMAEAKCIRALIHFDLVRIFARPFNFTNDASHLGIVVLTKPQLFADVLPKRVTVAETYQAIIKDLNEAIAAFGDENTGVLSSGYKQNYFTKLSAKALLAKVYLNQNNWDNAYTVADEIIKSNQYALVTNAAYVSSWTGRVPSTESVFELAIENSFGGNGLGAYYDIANTSYRMFAATTDITGLYSNTDVRRASSMFNTVTINAVNYFFTKKYAAGGTAQTPIKVLRLSDLYLIRAEAATEKSIPDFAQANSDLNTIRKRGDASATTANLTIKGDLIDAILLERRKELAFEGNLLFDLLRRKKDLVRVDVTALNKNLITNDPKLVMPLPAVTVNANNNIVQNPSY